MAGGEVAAACHAQVFRLGGQLRVRCRLVQHKREQSQRLPEDEIQYMSVSDLLWRKGGKTSLIDHLLLHNFEVILDLSRLATRRTNIFIPCSPPPDLPPDNQLPEFPECVEPALGLEERHCGGVGLLGLLHLGLRVPLVHRLGVEAAPQPQRALQLHPAVGGGGQPRQAVLGRVKLDPEFIFQIRNSGNSVSDRKRDPSGE